MPRRRCFLYALVALGRWDPEVQEALRRAEVDVLDPPPDAVADRVEVTVALAALNDLDVFRRLSAVLRGRCQIRLSDVVSVSGRNEGPPERGALGAL